MGTANELRKALDEEFVTKPAIRNLIKEKRDGVKCRPLYGKVVNGVPRICMAGDNVMVALKYLYFRSG